MDDLPGEDWCVLHSLLGLVPESNASGWVESEVVQVALGVFHAEEMVLDLRRYPAKTAQVAVEG